MVSEEGRILCDYCCDAADYGISLPIDRHLGYWWIDGCEDCADNKCWLDVKDCAREHNNSDYGDLWCRWTFASSAIDSNRTTSSDG